MLFNSFEYLFIFLPILLFIYYYINFKINYTKIVLIIFGLFFYSYWNINFLPILLFSIIINYLIAKKINNSVMNKKHLLIISIIFNLSLLILFKYLDFLIYNYNFLFDKNINYLNLPFPLAISFYTFQQITFLIDIYNREIKKNNFIDYILFVTFFPQLIAGPILTFNFLVKQFKFKNLKKELFYDRFPFGIFLISVGLFKKVFIADNLGIFVGLGFENYYVLDFFSSWYLSLSFAFQFYFDFTGYVDMAAGSAYLFGILLPQNFNSPYKSRNLIDFWKRWHMTLTSFLTRYIYFPLAKNFREFNLTNSLFIILIVFLISGLWHGPSWLFVIFGLMHGIGVIINHILKEKFPNFKINYFLSCLITFAYINFTFIFFRSQTIDQALSIIKKMLFLDNYQSINSINNFFNILSLSNNFKNLHIFLIIFSFVIVFLFNNTFDIKKKFKNRTSYLLISLFAFIVGIFSIGDSNEFIYFKF